MTDPSTRSGPSTFQSGRPLQIGLSATEAAQLLGISEKTIRRAIARGDLPATRHGRSYSIEYEHLLARFPGLTGPLPSGEAIDEQSRTAWNGSSPVKLIGREREISDLLSLLRQPEARLVTITGIGGVGKSSLAKLMTAELSVDFADGALFVDLTKASRPSDVARLVVEAAKTYPGQRTSEVAVFEFFANKEALILLDNFEHVLDADGFAGRLLEACPNCVMLVTSRIPLRIDGQQEYRLETLGIHLPEDANQVSLRLASDATRLFVNRVREINPEFALGPETAADVSDIVLRTDGIPLAIEMAAAQLRKYSLPELRVKLDARMPVLVAGEPQEQPWHQTLEDTIAWSYDLLSSIEQRIFRAVSAVPGGFGPELASALVPDIEVREIDGVLAGLEQKNLIQKATADGRFLVLETIRQFGVAALVREREWDEIRRRCIEHFLHVADAFAREFRSTSQRRWIDRIAGDLPGIRAALIWSSEFEAKESVLSLAYALRMFWAHEGRLAECLEWTSRGLSMEGATDPLIEASGRVAAAFAAKQLGDAKVSNQRVYEAFEMLTSLPPSEPLAIALETLGDLALNTGEFDRSDDWHRRMLEVAEKIGDSALAASAMNGLGLSAAMKGDHKSAIDLLTAASERAETSGDPRTSARLANSLAMAHTWAGNLDEASLNYQRALSFFRSIDDHRDIFVVLNNLGHVALTLRKLDDAELLLQEAEAGLHAAGDQRNHAMALSNLGMLANARNQHDAAVEALASAAEVFIGFGDRRLIAEGFALWGVCLTDQGEWAKALTTFAAMQQLFPDMDHFLDSGTMDLRRHALRAARAALDPEERDKAIRLGQSIDLNRLLVFIRHGQATNGAVCNAQEEVSVTPRELQILRLLADGLTDQQIADQLFLSKRTVSTHVANILGKLGVDSRTAAVSVAFRKHLTA